MRPPSIKHALISNRYLRGQVPEIRNGGPTHQRGRRRHLYLYRRTRRRAQSLWMEIMGMETLACDDTRWPEKMQGGKVPCFLWRFRSWSCGMASWCESSAEPKLKVGSWVDFATLCSHFHHAVRDRRSFASRFDNAAPDSSHQVNVPPCQRHPGSLTGGLLGARQRRCSTCSP